MKKRILWKDIKKSIIKSKGRFVSIMCLVALGCFALVGLQASGPDMRKTGEHYFTQLRAADLTVIGDYGIDENNEAAIDKISGASAIDYGYLKDVTITGELTSIRIFSMTENVSQYELVDGAMPEVANEIALASYFADRYAIGDTISFSEKEDASGDTVLVNHEFMVVGFVNSSELMSATNAGVSTAGTGELSGYAVVVPEAFDSDVYMIARLTFADTEGVDPYSEEYTDLVQAHKDELNELLADQPELRLADIRAEYQAEIDDGQQEVDDAKAELFDAKTQLDDARSQLDDANAEVDSARSELTQSVADAESQISDGASQIASAESQIADSQSELDAAKTAIADGESELSAAKEELAAKKAELAAAQAAITESEAELDSKKSALQEKESEYATQKSALEEKESAYALQKAALEEKEQTYESSYAAYSAKKAFLDSSGLSGEELERQQQALALYEAELVKSKQELETWKSTLAAARQELDLNKARLAAARQELDSGWTEIENAEATLEASRQQLADGQAQITAAETELAEKEALLDEKETAYASGVSTIESARAELSKKESELAAAKSELAEKKSDGEQQISDAEAEIAAQESEFQDALAEYNEQLPDAESEIADAEDELADAQEQVDALALPTYAVDTRREIPGAEGYRVYVTVSRIVDDLADIFPVFFYLVAALVTLTTMTRFVDEERTNCGTLYALGYETRDIVRKFTVYGSAASLSGAVGGIVAGHIVIPLIVYNAYKNTSTFPQIELHFYPVISVIALVLSFVSAVIPAYLVAMRTLKEQPAALLLPKAPAAASAILLERVHFIWNRMNFTHKVTARNLFRYKKRMAMTIFGVCGAVTLLFTGFSVQHSISGINDRQFGEILRYDLIVARSDTDEDQAAEVDGLLASDEIKQQTAIFYEKLYKVAGDNQDRQEIKLIVPESQDTFSDYICLNERKSGEEIMLSDDGMVISERLAKLLKVSIGDTITFSDADNVEYEMRVGAVTEMYTGHFMFMNPTYYESVFGESCRANANLVILKDGSVENAKEQAAAFIQLDGVTGVVQNTTMMNQIDTIVAALDKIMDVLILVAMLLAVVILFNLTNINVSERIRELSTIKVLGFYDKEVTMYIYRETILLTAAGILAGYVTGDLLYRYILYVVPPEETMFNPALGAQAFLVPAAVIGLITLVLGFAVNRTLRDVDMMEALKSVD